MIFYGHNCDRCGRFVNVNAPGVGWVFVPDAGIPGMYEEDRARCPACVEKHGKPRPSQNVVEGRCCGINPPNAESEALT